MEFKSGPIQISIGPKPRDAAADRNTLALIQAKMTAGDIEAAVAMGEAAFADGLEHPLTFNLAAGRLESEDRFGEALALLERGHKQTPSDLGLRQALALCLFRLQRFAAALPHFDAIVAAQPSFAPAHAARGVILEQVDRLGEAEDAYRRAYDLQPDNLLAMSGLASVASRAGRNAEAREFAEKVLAGEPGYPDAVIVLARADLAEGYYADGESRLQALMVDPRVPPGVKDAVKTLLGEIDAAKSRKFDA